MRQRVAFGRYRCPHARALDPVAVSCQSAQFAALHHTCGRCAVAISWRPAPCSGAAFASQDARLSFLFIRENNHSTMIIDKVAFSTRCVPANHLLTRLSNSLQTPTWVWVNPERGAARRNRAPMVGFSFEDVGFKLELGAPWPFVVGLRRDPSPRADRRANASSGEREPTRSGYPRACRQRSISHCFW